MGKTSLHRNQLAPSPVLHLPNSRQSKWLAIITATDTICSFQGMGLTWIPHIEKGTEREERQESFFLQVRDLNNELE